MSEIAKPSSLTDASAVDGAAGKALVVPDGAETRLKAEVDKDEALLQQSLSERMQMMQKEASKLTAAKKELERMGFDHRRDIDELRQRIEQNSRELSYANATLRQKAKEHEDAKARVSELAKAKEMMTEHLRVIIYENEKRKKKKLEEIMKRIGISSGGSDGGSAPASPHSSKKPPPAGEPSASRTSRAWSGF